jgi:E3 ubiquitin-protein ligase DOA10
MRKSTLNRLLSSPTIDKSRRKTTRIRPLKRTDNEAIIIHSDSEEEEKRINNEIIRLKERMEEIDRESRNIRYELAKKYEERESVRIARRIRINNLKIKKEFEERLFPKIEEVATARNEIINRSRDLFNDIDDHSDELPPSYESLYGNENTSEDEYFPSVEECFNSNNNTNSN